MPRRTSLLVVVGVVLSLGACSDTPDSGDAQDGDHDSPVVATTAIWADITRNVACGELEVPSLVPAGADSHSHEAGVHDADELRGARLVVANGLGLEERLVDALDSARGDGVEVLELAAVAAPDGPDPHVWLDPDLVAEVVPTIAEALGSVQDLGVSPAELDRCAREYAAALHRLGEEMDETLAVVPAERRLLVSDHESLGHFASRFDFETVGAVVPSTSSLGEANARELDELAATIRRLEMPAIFVEAADSHHAADAIADRLGSDVTIVELHVEAPAEGDRYEDMLRENARLVADALAPRR